jgi:uncharacterized membrane protein YeaQ/YmgE (transglycosylase-associated protein family)
VRVWGRGFGLFRNLFWAVIVGGLTGLVASSVSPTKKGATTDVVLGMVGAFLGGVFLSFIRFGVPRLFGVLIFQVVGALVLILVGRMVIDQGK